MRTINQTIYDLWRPLRQKVGHNLKELYMRVVQQFLDSQKSETYAENAALILCYLYVEEDYEQTYLVRMKWSHRIKIDEVHRKVVKTLRRFMDEDDMDFDEAAESAGEKWKFLLNRIVRESRVMTKKPKKRSKRHCDTLNQPRDSYKRVF